jgi:hypothetical protein
MNFVLEKYVFFYIQNSLIIYWAAAWSVCDPARRARVVQINIIIVSLKYNLFSPWYTQMYLKNIAHLAFHINY